MDRHGVGDYCLFVMGVGMARFNAAIPPVVAGISEGDRSSFFARDGHGCPKLNAQSFARMRNQQSVHMARGIVLFVGQHFSGSLFE